MNRFRVTLEIGVNDVDGSKYPGGVLERVRADAQDALQCFAEAHQWEAKVEEVTEDQQMESREFLEVFLAAVRLERRQDDERSLLGNLHDSASSWLDADVAVLVEQEDALGLIEVLTRTSGIEEVFDGHADVATYLAEHPELFPEKLRHLHGRVCEIVDQKGLRKEAAYLRRGWEEE